MNQVYKFTIILLVSIDSGNVRLHIGDRSCAVEMQVSNIETGIIVAQAMQESQRSADIIICIFAAVANALRLELISWAVNVLLDCVL